MKYLCIPAAAAALLVLFGIGYLASLLPGAWERSRPTGDLAGFSLTVTTIVWLLAPIFVGSLIATYLTWPASARRVGIALFAVGLLLLVVVLASLAFSGVPPVPAAAVLLVPALILGSGLLLLGRRLFSRPESFPSR